MSMKTYLLVWFNTEGAKPSEITERLLSAGFRPVHGNYDYVYDWDEDATVEDAIRIGDRVQDMLKGFNIMFKMETVSGTGERD